MRSLRGRLRLGMWAGTLLHWRSAVVGVVLAVLLVRALPAALAAGYNWLQFDGNAQHSGNNTQESAITLGNVSGLQSLFHLSLPSTADGAPAFLSNVSTTSGVQDLVYLTTRDGHILALNARTGAQAWSKQYGPGSCHINNGSDICYTTSSPAIDPSGSFVYSYGLDGKVHKYAAGSGAETTGNGWPEIATLKPFDEKGSSALTIATARNGTSYLYVTNGGYPGDNGDYQGHITAINLSTGRQQVFNAACSNQAVHFVETPGSPDCALKQTAVWARSGVVYDPGLDRIYAATGNGTFDPGQFGWGDTVFALNPDGTGNGSGNPLDSFTPPNFLNLQQNDTDIGSTAPAILPVPAASTVQHLAVQSGKDGKLRLLNLANLSGQGGPGNTGGEVSTTIGVPQGNEVLTAPAVWVNPADNSTWVFVANDNGISGLQVKLDGNNIPFLHPVWQTGNGGTSPIVANGVLYYAGFGTVRALDPTTGAQHWSAAIGGIHWESPIVANGVLYITDNNSMLNAYALPSTTPTSTATSKPSSTRTRTATRTPQPSSSQTRTPIPTRTQTPRPSGTRTATITPTRTRTVTATSTRTRTATATPTTRPTGATATRTPTPTGGSVGLPAPWAGMDIGAVGTAGNAGYASGTFTSSGAGSGIGGSADAFHFVYQSLTGDGQITARVVSVQGTGAARVGMMMRSALTPGASEALIALTPAQGSIFARRVTTGGSTLVTAGPAVSSPYWILLTRRQNVLYAYTSSTGSRWQLVGSASITMPSTVYAGLAVTSGEPAALASGTFDHVAVSVARSSTQGG